MSYRLDPSGCVTRLADNVLVCEADPAWQDYLAWLEAGNSPRPYPDYQLVAVGVKRLPDGLIVTRSMPEATDYRAWLKAGNMPLPMEPVTKPQITIADAKRRKIKMLTDEALERTAAILPEFGNMSTLIVMRELYLSIAPAARQPTTKLTSVINIYLAWENAVSQVKACSTYQCIINVSAAWP